ncbi:MAG TPA: arsenic resistance N-acetyltransferase ArsN2 [Steroidobacteraceae bacterium]|nr:arsenic resistance N-acetyltransferase ArsN2 [Steroidobacteraceae bacterium]
MASAEPPTLRTAAAADAQSIHALLERSGLPTGDLGTARPEFIVADDAGQIVGSGALQRFGKVALLRSVAVEPRRRGTGVGRSIIEELERRARAAGIDELILLTMTARDFFERLGYHPRSRDRVPPPVLDSAEFRSLCPASAVCMAKSLR